MPCRLCKIGGSKLVKSVLSGYLAAALWIIIILRGRKRRFMAISIVINEVWN